MNKSICLEEKNFFRDKNLLMTKSLIIAVIFNIHFRRLNEGRSTRGNEEKISGSAYTYSNMKVPVQNEENRVGFEQLHIHNYAAH